MTSRGNDLQTIFWEATLKCNARCPFCGSRCGENAVSEVDGETVIRTFKKIADAYDASKIMIDVTGGEPLLRSDLFEVMQAVKEMGFHWGMVTNGSLINAEIIDKMEESGMQTISVSIDNLYEKHESVRGLPGAFSKIIQAIHDLADRHFLDQIQITTVVTKNNLQDLTQMYEYFSNLPVNSWRLAQVDPIGRCTEHDEILLEKADFGTLIDFFRQHAFSPKLQLLTSCSHYLGKNDTLFRPLPFKCSTGKTVASILADGSIFVCPNVPRRKELLQGNIRTDDFVERWEKGFTFFRTPENRKTGKCLNCAEWEKCQGDSLHTWNFDKQTPDFCIRDFADDVSIQKAVPESILKELASECENLTGYKISYGSSSGRLAVFLPSASEELNCLFHWGKHHPLNACEQLAAAVGFSENDIFYVEGIISLPFQNRSENCGTSTSEIHAYALEEADMWNRNREKAGTMFISREKSVRLLGYIHSHPGCLSVKMSQGDIQLHDRLKNLLPESYFTGIMNPQSRDFGIYTDSIFSPNDILLLMGGKELEKWAEG